MQRKTKYYLVGLSVLIIFVVGYHFYAASQAEAQIDEAIQEQVGQSASTTTTVTYSSIDVSPFKGDIQFEDLSVMSPSAIHRSRTISLDLSYMDFLRIYTMDLKYGLEHLAQARVLFEQPMLIDRESFGETRFDVVDLIFEGNAWDALLSLINSTPLQTAQSIRLTGQSLTYSTQDTFPGTIKAERVYSEHLAPTDSRQWWKQSEHRVNIEDIVWAPPLSFQEQYGFFIRGFGYETDSIPADSLKFKLTSSSADSSILSLKLFTDLFDTEITSRLLINQQSFINSRLLNGTVRIGNTSQEFNAFSKNLKQLIGVDISNQESEILRFSGTLNNPQISIQP